MPQEEFEMFLLHEERYYSYDFYNKLFSSIHNSLNENPLNEEMREFLYTL